MNIDETLVAVEIMQGFANGKEIHTRALDDDDSDWTQVDNPVWDWYNFTYRIRPWYYDLMDGIYSKVLCHIDQDNPDMIRIIIEAIEDQDADGNTVITYKSADGTEYTYAIPVGDYEIEGIIYE